MLVGWVYSSEPMALTTNRSAVSQSLVVFGRVSKREEAWQVQSGVLTLSVVRIGPSGRSPTRRVPPCVWLILLA